MAKPGRVPRWPRRDRAFLTRKWARELDYRLIKELWSFTDNRIAVRFAYEWRDDAGNWFRSHGNENWEFDERGLMRLRFASINDQPIPEEDRKFRWPQGPRPPDHRVCRISGFKATRSPSGGRHATPFRGYRLHPDGEEGPGAAGQPAAYARMEGCRRRSTMR